MLGRKWALVSTACLRAGEAEVFLQHGWTSVHEDSIPVVGKPGALDSLTHFSGVLRENRMRLFSKSWHFLSLPLSQLEYVMFNGTHRKGEMLL